MTAQEKIEKLAMACETIVRELVDYPDLVVVTSTLGDGGTIAVLTVRVRKSDFGKVIGRAGKNVAALRTLLEAIAAKQRLRLMLEIDDKVRD